LQDCSLPIIATTGFTLENRATLLHHKKKLIKHATIAAKLNFQKAEAKKAEDYQP